MTTISSTAASYSPKQHLLDTIASQVSAGKIGSSDQTALDTAVEDIDASLTSERSSSTGTRLDPSQVKSRIDDLVAGEVTKGTLTSDQADTLKQVLAQGQGTGHAGHHGHGGPAGVGGAGASDGPPPGPPPEQDGATDGGTASGSDSSSVSDLLASFIKQLQTAQSQSAGYAANGQTGSSRQASALLLNFEA